MVYIYFRLFFIIILFYQTCVKDYPVISSRKNLVQTIIGHRKPSASIKMVVIHGCRMLVGFQKYFFLLFFLGGHVSFLITVFHSLVNTRWHKQDSYTDVDTYAF